jgi:hypothetical protein
MSKLLEIQIALDDLEFLKTKKYMLCFATGLQSNPAVVWQCFSDYLQNNPFSLLPQYQVFGTSSFNVGSVVTIDIDAVTIALGEQTTLTADAVFQPPVAGGAGESLTVNNQYGQEIHLGFSCALTGPDNVQRTTPIFVTSAVVGPDVFVFTPVDSVRVWLQPDIVTGAIIGPDIPNSIEIDLRARDFGKLRYQDGKWSE